MTFFLKTDNHIELSLTLQSGVSHLTHSDRNIFKDDFIRAIYFAFRIQLNDSSMLLWRYNVL